MRTPIRNALLAAASCVAVAGSVAGQQRERLTPYLERTDPAEWVLKTTLTLAPVTESIRTKTREADTFDIEAASIFFPVAPKSSSHQRDPRATKAEFLLFGQPVELKQTVVDRNAGGEPLHSGAAYLDCAFKELEDVPVSAVFTVETRMTCWNTAFDEASAMKVPWPEGEWPDEARSTFEPMLFVDEGFEERYERRWIERLAENMTEGRARSQPPMVAAKWIAGELAKAFQPVGNGIITDAVPATPTQSAASVGAVSAIEVVGAAESAKRGRGSPFDMPLLLTALYREVGIPARLVVGYVAGGQGGGNEAFRSIDRAEVGLYAWVEVALYDESQARPDEQLTWVPVDINRIKADGVFRRPFDQPWDGFGSSDKLSEILPIAFHLHPHRMGGISYGVSSRRKPMPALWGWNVVPETPEAVRQTLTFSATTPARGPGDDRRRRGQ